MKYKTGKKTGLKYLTYDHIKSYDPCYDPIRFIPTDWKGTAVDVLKMEDVSFADRLWCILRSELVSERVMWLFAVWSYRQTLKFVKDLDPRSIKAADVAEAYALGKATAEELSAAKSAKSAAWSAAESAAKSAKSAAKSAAESAQKTKLIEMILEEGKLRKGTKK